MPARQASRSKPSIFTIGLCCLNQTAESEREIPHAALTAGTAADHPGEVRQTDQQHLSLDNRESSLSLSPNTTGVGQSQAEGGEPSGQETSSRQDGAVSRSRTYRACLPSDTTSKRTTCACLSRQMAGREVKVSDKLLGKNR
ncbi:hypothetical protein PoB_004506300 [Plakobranchus ocellatus]|uniref:Uncharacterized protein n=1 Tax=Plakobranchus ocellatus TaxID=259542 RepID=A0AAV4BHC1_9GAST|nr:hypothetical protein PoB_004506300 [Plakobranchus ocellatus]